MPTKNASKSKRGGSDKPNRAKGAAAVAELVLKGESEHDAAYYVAALADERRSVATQAARVVDELVAREPKSLAGQTRPLSKGLMSANPRVVQACAHALPAVAAVAPAKVARRLPSLMESYDEASEAAKDGLVHTFATLCNASVAYQKRLEDVLKHALSEADPKTLQRWSELVLPALKGEPHARARAVVEARLMDIPRPIAQKIAAFHGIKLRPAPR